VKEKMHKRIWLILIPIFSVFLLCTFITDSLKHMTSVEQVLTRKIEKGRSPSIQYFFFDKDSIIASCRLGFSDIARQKRPDPTTTYNAFSVTKTFTALAVVQLAERGVIDLNKLVKDYLPDFSYSEGITVKHLLTHSAGIPNPIPLSWIHLDSEHATFDRTTFFKPVFDKNNKVRFEPNEKFAYSNLGYLILGQLIEKVSGQSYEAYIQQHIIDKLSVGSAELGFTIANKERHAKGYHKRFSFSNLVLGFFIDKSIYMGEAEGSWRPFKTFYVNGSPYGGLVGTPLAFVKYIQELLKPNSKLISEEFKQLLFLENITNNNKPTGMCLSWFTGTLHHTKYFAHAGGGGGYYCEIRIYPDINKGSVLFFNRTGMTDERFLDQLDIFYISGGQ